MRDRLFRWKRRAPGRFLFRTWANNKVRLMMGSRQAAAILVALAVCASQASAALFSENFNDGLAGSRWSVVSQQDVTGSNPPDGNVNLAFDYSILGLANPSGGDTIGGYIRTNLTNQPGDEGESYSIYPNGQSFSGNFFVQMDMIVYNESLGGQTEFGMAGVFLDNANPVSPYQNGAKGGPLALEYSGDGFTTDDLFVFKEGTASTNGAMSLGSYDNVPTGTIPGFETGVIGSRGPAPAATAVKGSWVKVRIESTGTQVKFLLNGTVVNTYDNSGGHYTAGNILISSVDPFNSVSTQASGVIVDNIVVGVPEPAAGVLAVAALGMLPIARRRER